MSDASTNWTVVELAGRGDRDARETFARVYLPIVRSYVRSRWQATPWRSQIDDAAQQVFVECLKSDGALSRISRDDPWGFRNYLFGLTRNVARTIERSRKQEFNGQPDEISADDDSGLQRSFDRAFVEALLAEALALHQRMAEDGDQAALRRFELLRLRFWNAQPIRDIAAKWGVDAAQLHHDYARARNEFRDALRIVLQDHCGRHATVTESDLVALLASN